MKRVRLLRSIVRMEFYHRMLLRDGSAMRFEFGKFGRGQRKPGDTRLLW